MDLVTEEVGDVTVVTLPTMELDASNVADFKRDVAPILQRSQRIIFDLGGLRFIDSSGLGAFISCLRKVTMKGGDLMLCGMTAQVRTVFELVRLHRILRVLPSREVALAAALSQGHANHAS